MPKHRKRGTVLCDTELVEARRAALSYALKKPFGYQQNREEIHDVILSNLVHRKAYGEIDIALEFYSAVRKVSEMMRGRGFDEESCFIIAPTEDQSRALRVVNGMGEDGRIAWCSLCFFKPDESRAFWPNVLEHKQILRQILVILIAAGSFDALYVLRNRRGTAEYLTDYASSMETLFWEAGRVPSTIMSVEDEKRFLSLERRKRKRVDGNQLSTVIAHPPLSLVPRSASR